MKSLLAILLVAIVLLVAGLCAWLAIREPMDAASSALTIEHAPESAVVPRGPADLAVDARPQQAAATERETAVQPLEKPSAAAPAKPLGPAVVEIRFVDGDRLPIAHAHVVVESKVQASAESANDGRVRVEVALEGDARDFTVRATAKDCVPYVARVHLEREKTLRLGDVVLELGGEIAGVVLGPDNQPFEGASVSVGEDAPPHDPDVARVNGPQLPGGWPSVKSLARGEFHIEGAPARNVRLWATAKGMRHTCSEPIEVVPRQLHGNIVLKLERLARDEMIEGIVVSPDAKPVPKALLRYGWSMGNSTWSSTSTAGDDGRFRILAPKKVPFEITAEDLEKRWRSAVKSGVMPGTSDVVLELAEARWIELAVLAAGKPVMEFATKVRKPEEPSAHQSSTKHLDGRERLVVPAQRFVIDVVARGCATKTLGPFEPESAPETLAVLLEVLPGLRGRVTSRGQPVSGARIELHKIVARTERGVHNGFFSRLQPNVEEAETTDADGRYQLSARDDGTFALLCIATGHALAEISPLEVVAAKGAEGLDFALVGGGSIEGRVLVAAGKNASGLVVAANRGDARAQTTRTGADGAFRFERLTPGRWNVTRAEVEISPFRSSTMSSDGETKELEIPWNCVVDDGRTTRFDVDARDAAPCILAGHVEVNHSPATGWSVHVAPELNVAFTEPPGGTVDSHGDVRVEVAEPGSYRITLRPPGSSMPQGEFATSVKLARGSNPWTVAFDVGALEASGGLTDPSARYTMDSGGAGGIAFNAEMPLETGGVCHFPIVLAGTVVVRRIEKESAYNWREAATLDVVVTAGGVKQITLP
jgi:hypothetical protein